jgi:hypothetical protein
VKQHVGMRSAIQLTVAAFRVISAPNSRAARPIRYSLFAIRHSPFTFDWKVP